MSELKVMQELMTSERMSYLKVTIEGVEIFNHQDPMHLRAIIQALQDYPGVQGLVIGGLKETLIKDRALDLLKEVAEIRRLLQRYSTTAQPPGGEDGKISGKCSRCPSNPERVFKEALEDFDRDPLNWKGLKTSLKGRGLKQCGRCLNSTEGILRRLKSTYMEAFKRIEVLG
ncbi:MAG: hypothetical protein J7L88_00320 [Thermoplasmata archaeon]|nr:hypothetical protein [Thermoplasmata archaeon]